MIQQMRMIRKPEPGEYPAYASIYIDLVPNDGLLLEHLAQSAQSTAAVVRAAPPARLDYRYAPGKWTIKDILGHLADDERIYVYRALRFARNDPTELPGFEQDDYARESGAATRSVDDLLDELATIRQSTIAFFASLSDEALARSGVANGHAMTVRALAYHIVGHEMRHVAIIRERYLSA
jgi:uncharacterized damage-inducible protein DinB